MEEFNTAITGLEKEDGLSGGEVKRLIEEALVATYTKRSGGQMIQAEFDMETGNYRLVTGGEAEQEVEVPADFARDAAGAVRLAVLGAAKRRERERRKEEIDQVKGELRSMVVSRTEEGGWWLRDGETLAWLPKEEQIRGERLTPNQLLGVVVVGEAWHQGQVAALVSRNSPELLYRFLEREIPEIASGVVAVMGIAREAGACSKVAVVSSDAKIDARGACLGRQGVRQKAVAAEFPGEQVQIVDWAEDPAQYVANALAPAKAQKVEMDQSGRTANAVVADDQLSLAIGRGGLNARLVAKLTGLRVNVTALGKEL